MNDLASVYVRIRKCHQADLSLFHIDLVSQQAAVVLVQPSKACIASTAAMDLGTAASKLGSW